jgi:hypothetical protein
MEREAVKDKAREKEKGAGSAGRDLASGGGMAGAKRPRIEEVERGDDGADDGAGERRRMVRKRDEEERVGEQAKARAREGSRGRGGRGKKEGWSCFTHAKFVVGV